MFALFPKLYRKFFPLAAKMEKRRREARYAQRPTLERLEDRLAPATDVFTGGGDWMAPAGWSLTRLPGSSDVAEIDAPCVLNNTNPQTVAGLTVNSQLNLGSKLSVTTGSTASGSTFNEGTGGDLDVISSMDFQGNGVISGRIDTGSSINFDYFSAMTLAAGTSFIGGGLMNVSGPVTITGALNPDAQVVLNNDGGNLTNGSLAGPGSLEIGKDMTWNGGPITLGGGLTIDSAGSLDVTGPDSKTLTALLTNESMFCNFEGTGTLHMMISGSSAVGTISCPVGEVDMSIPTIDVPGMGSSGSGGINIGGDGTLKETGSTTIFAPFTNTGRVDVASGADLTLSNMAPGSAADAMDGSYQLDGDMTLLGNFASTGLALDSGGAKMKIGNGMGSTSSVLTLTSGVLGIFGNLEVTSTGKLTGGEVDNSGDLILDVGSTTTLNTFKQFSTGTLDIHAALLDMTPVAAGLAVSGDAELSGTLKLDPDNGYQPTSGTKFRVLTAGSIGAHFDTTPDGWTTSQSSTEVDITKN